MNLHLGLAFNLLRRTFPLLLIRFGATLAFWVVALIYLSLAGGVSFLIGQAIDWLGVIFFLIAIGGLLPLYNLAYRYVFYIIKAAHIAVMAKLLQDDNLPDGINQLEYGREQVQERFGEINGMFVVDELVTGVVRAFTGTVINVVRWIPGDSADSLISVVERIIKYATNYIDEAILGRSFWTEDEQSIWQNARDGSVLYAMQWQPMLKTAVALMVISFLTGVAGFVILAAPVGALLYFINPQLAGWTVILLFLLAWMIKISIGDAFAVAAILAAYQRETQGLTPNPEMVARLDSISDAFGDLQKRAEDAVSPAGKLKQKPPTGEDSAFGVSGTSDEDPSSGGTSPTPSST